MNFPHGYFAQCIFDKKTKTYEISFPDFPTVFTVADDLEQAQEMALEALTSALETDFDRGEDLPKSHSPSTKAKKDKTSFFVKIPPSIYIAYVLRYWREKSQLTQKQVASRLGVTYQAYQRMEKPGKANLTVETLSNIFSAMGLEFDLKIGKKTAA